MTSVAEAVSERKKRETARMLTTHCPQSREVVGLWKEGTRYQQSAMVGAIKKLTAPSAVGRSRIDVTGTGRDRAWVLVVVPAMS